MSKKSSFTDDGWAVWIDGDDTSTVYISEWLNPKGKSYMDIAIHTTGIRQTDSLNIYIPFHVEYDEVDDVSLLLKDESILYVTFNTACIIDYQKNEFTSEIAYNGKTLDVVHISRVGYEMTQLADGTLFYMDLERLQEYLANDEAYFLFRIPYKSIDRVFKQDIGVNLGIKRLKELISTPVITERYGCSVRINESRLLPMEINRKGSFHRQKLKRAVISISINEEYKVNDSGCYRIRRLEESLYNNYVPDGFTDDNVVTYQWEQSKEDNLRGHYNFYFSIMHNSVSCVSVVLYIIILVFFSGFGSAMSEIVMQLIQK